VTKRDDDLRIRPGRIQHGNRGGKRPRTFVGEVMRAAKKAGHVGNSFRSSQGRSRSGFGRGRRAALSLSSQSARRRDAIMTRIVRHQGKRFKASLLAKHVSSISSAKVSRETERSHVRAASDAADAKAFAERCEDDHHDLLFSVSPEATQMDLRTFTRELMTNAEIDFAKEAGLNRCRSPEYRQRTSMSWCAGVPMAVGT
jgi:hypothetical protein